MAYEHILVEKEEGVAILTMNRPEVLNAMNAQLSWELHDAVTAANADDEIRCIVITGTGNRAFTAGGDIHEQREEARGNLSEARQRLGAGRIERSYDISASPKPVIGMMNGLALDRGGIWRRRSMTASPAFRLSGNAATSSYFGGYFGTYLH